MSRPPVSLLIDVDLAQQATARVWPVDALLSVACPDADGQAIFCEIEARRGEPVIRAAVAALDAYVDACLALGVAPAATVEFCGFGPRLEPGRWDVRLEAPAG